jgi:type IV pilus assembly protein PilW
MHISGSASEKAGRKGFTLVELLMAMMVFGLVMAAVFASYRSQQRSQTAQEAVVDMQQNIRAAMLVMAQEIREAGCDPTERSGAGIVMAQANLFQFTKDIAGDPNLRNSPDGRVTGPNENISFGFSPANDTGGTGVIPDGGAAGLGRNTGSGLQPIAENIAAIEFRYLLRDGTLTTNPDPMQLPQIVGVQISLLARAGRIDPDYTDLQTYTTAAGTVWGPYNDHFRRKLDIITIHLRNKFF